MIKDIYSLIIGQKYKITFPNYDEFPLPETMEVSIISKTNKSYFVELKCMSI